MKLTPREEAFGRKIRKGDKLYVRTDPPFIGTVKLVWGRWDSLCIDFEEDSNRGYSVRYVRRPTLAEKERVLRLNAAKLVIE